MNPKWKEMQLLTGPLDKLGLWILYINIMINGENFFSDVKSFMSLFRNQSDFLKYSFTTIFKKANF